MTAPDRHPAEEPTRPEPQVRVGDRVELESDDPSCFESWSRPLDGDAEFNRRVRAILGVTDGPAKVTVTMAGATHDMFGSGSTFESWEDITVGCAGLTATFADLPTLLRHLAHADHPAVTADRVAAMIGHRVAVHTMVGPVLTGVLGNANGWLMYLTADAVQRGPGLDWSGHVIRPQFNQVLHIELEE